MTSIVIPDGVATIGSAAFQYCNSITSIVVSDGNTTYDSRNNCNAIIETSTNTLIIGCKTTIIPNSVTTIGNDAFFMCADITSIIIPNSVTKIIYRAFYGCTSLTSITIPNSITSIGWSAFSGCSKLTTLTVEASTPPTFGVEMLSGCSKLSSIKVPASSADAYKTANGWKDYASIIVGF